MSNPFGKIIQNGVEYDVSPYAHKIEITITTGEKRASILRRLTTALIAKVPNLRDIKSIMLEECTDDPDTHTIMMADIYLPSMIIVDLNQIHVVNISTAHQHILEYTLSATNASARRISLRTSGIEISDASNETLYTNRMILYYS